MAVRRAILFLRSKYSSTQNNSTTTTKQKPSRRLDKKNTSSSSSSSASSSSSSSSSNLRYSNHETPPKHAQLPSSPNQIPPPPLPIISPLSSSSSSEIQLVHSPLPSPPTNKINTMMVKLTSPSSSSLELLPALKHVSTDSSPTTPLSQPLQEPSSNSISLVPAPDPLLVSSPPSSTPLQDPSEPGSPPLSIPKAPSFWKRISRSSKKNHANLHRDIPRAFSDSELHTIKATSPDIPHSPVVIPHSSDASDIPKISPQAASVDLAGVGVRDRRSIAASSFSTSNPSTPPTKTHKTRPSSNYSPATSSPLSSQADFEDGPLPTSNSSPNLGRQNSLLSASGSQPSSILHPTPRPRIGAHRSRLSYQQNRLSFIPDGAAPDSGDLMRILRGPSAYPAEARPRSTISSSCSAPNSRPPSRLGRVSTVVQVS